MLTKIKSSNEIPKLLLVLSLLLLALLSSTSSHAQSTSKPEAACPKALSDCDKALYIQRVYSTKLVELNVDLRAQNEAIKSQDAEKQAKLDSAFRNPFIMVGIGLLVGATTAVIIHK